MDSRLLGLHLLTPAFGLLTALRGITALLGAQQQTVAFIILNVEQTTLGWNSNYWSKCYLLQKYVLVLSCSLLLQIHFRLAFLYNVHYAKFFFGFYFRLGSTLGPICIHYTLFSSNLRLFFIYALCKHYDLSSTNYLVFMAVVHL